MVEKNRMEEKNIKILRKSNENHEAKFPKLRKT